jgi:hypothetical protein
VPPGPGSPISPGVSCRSGSVTGPMGADQRVHRLHNVEHSHGPTWELASAVNTDLRTVPPCQVVSCCLRNWYRVYDPDFPRDGTADSPTFVYSVARRRFCRQPARHQYVPALHAGHGASIQRRFHHHTVDSVALSRRHGTRTVDYRAPVRSVRPTARASDRAHRLRSWLADLFLSAECQPPNLRPCRAGHGR